MNTPCRIALITLPLLLAACGGGTVGGTVSGLPDGESVTLQNSTRNNGNDTVTVSRNGAFEFDETVLEESSYSVTVTTQPATAYCTVANGSGTIPVESTAAVEVTVTCSPSARIAGTLSGLTTGAFVQLINSGTSGSGATDPLTLTSNGSFSFPGTKSAGTTYTVTVSNQTAGQNCAVTGGTGTGTVTANTPTAITVACVP